MLLSFIEVSFIAITPPSEIFALPTGWWWNLATFFQFLTSTSTSHILQKQCPFPYQPFIGEYCESLAKDLEFPSDSSLLYIIQLQYLSEKMTSVSMQQFSENQTVSSAIQHRFQELHSELEAYRANLPFSLRENRKCWET
jgi:hypothetical protein